MTSMNSVAGIRKNCSAEFKAKVALEPIRAEVTVAQLGAKHGVHQTLINTWKRQAIEGMSGIFSGKAQAKAAEKEGEIGKLHAKFGQLLVERDFFCHGRASEGATDGVDGPPAAWRCATVGSAWQSTKGGASHEAGDHHRPRSGQVRFSAARRQLQGAGRRPPSAAPLAGSWVLQAAQAVPRRNGGMFGRGSQTSTPCPARS